MTSRRAFLIGIGSTLAAPAIVRAENIMCAVMPARGLVLGNFPTKIGPGMVCYVETSFNGVDWLPLLTGEPVRQYVRSKFAYR